MKIATRMLGVAVVLLGMTVVGCKKVQLTFYNHTDLTLPVRVTTPDAGTMNVGSLAGNGGMLNFTIKLKSEDLPAACSTTVGVGTKSFTITEDTKNHLWFHYTDKGLAGPMDKNANMTVIQQTGEVRVRTESRMIVD